ncbi:hypothetical protein DL768_004484 [Monosporascus sp. mg162]|nr:hypothetical protein DL768_004484 [Monosporascus sp. mg162]
MATPSTISSDSTGVVKDLSVSLVFCGNDFCSDDLLMHFGSLQRNGRNQQFRILSSFLSESCAMLQHEISLLPSGLSETLPAFQDIQGLAMHFIGMLLGHCEAQSNDYNLHNGTTKLAGLSVGLLSSAAISVSSSLSSLNRAGIESARVAWRLGVHIHRLSQLLESHPTEGQPDSWAYVVTGLSESQVQEELDTINSTSSHPELLKVFISAADKNSVSVTGPPARLKSAFLSSRVLRYSRWLPLPVYGGLCHAPHLYTVEDVRSIVYGPEPRYNRDQRVLLPMFSSSHGNFFQEQTFDELLQAVVSEIMTGGIYLDSLSAAIACSLEQSSYCQFMTFRSSLITAGLSTAIESALPQLHLTKEDLVDWTTSDLPGIHPSSMRNSKLAIVGMSCRLPGGANNNELFWKLMVDGRDVHTRIPADRFDVEAHFDPTGKTPNSTQTPFGNFIDNPGHFDAGFFNMSPREAEETDPMHRLALVTAYEALEMSGYAPDRTPSTNRKRIGTYYGVASDDWREVNAGQNPGTYAVPGGERAFANGRINYFFKFGGPSLNMDTACSSGLAAVNAACSALWAGEADTVLAGGLNVITNPDNYCMLGRGHFLSLTGQCKVWDKDADGYCRADGVGAVVMKRLADAEADNDNILAVVIAGATNHSADAVSITHPHAGAQMENYSRVLAHSGISPLDVSYVELHGTGTQAGDAVESESVATVFAPIGARRRPEQRLHLGAVKSNIGHSEAAAGISSLIKALLVFQEGQIPRHVGIRTEINPVVARNLDRRNAGLALENTPWPRPQGKKRYALVNSFGAHGGNTSILLEDAPIRDRVGQDPRDTHVFTISAKSKNSLRGNMEAMIRYIDENPETSAADLSYTLVARRMHYHFRMTAAASSIGQFRKSLAASLEHSNGTKSVPTEAPPIVMTFTGQGAFYEGLSTQLYTHFEPYRLEVQQLDRLIQKLGFASILSHFEREPVEGGSVSRVSALATQLCVVVMEIALAHFWKLLGVVPNAVIGHSLGEYAALVTAGVLSAADAIYLVAKRAQIMAKVCEEGTHSMLSVRAGADTISDLIGTQVVYEFSCINGSEDTVVTGTRAAMDATKIILGGKGVKAHMLDLPHAFHSAQIDPVLDEFEGVAKHITFKTPSIPVISPLQKDCIFDGKTVNASYMARASRKPVDFVGALDAARDMGLVDNQTVWLDVGPHPVCGTFVRNWNVAAKTFASARKNEGSFATLAATLAGLHAAGVSLTWQEWYRPYEKASRLLKLESYKWNEKNYWIQLVGTWTLDKAFAGDKKRTQALGAVESSLRTSSIHQVLSEEVWESSTKVRCVAQSDLKHPSLLPSVCGHEMNGYGVASSSIWADMAYVLGEHVYKLAAPSPKNLSMNITNLEVLHAQVIASDQPKPHLIKTEAELDLNTRSTLVKWYHQSASGEAQEHFASCTIRYEDAKTWQLEWSRIAHLVRSRADELDRLATTGAATRLNRKMAYGLFGNVVNYAEKYRGMQTVALADGEACAQVRLADDAYGTWHTPPHWFDSVFHVGGLVLNGGDAVNNRDFFYVTPGWDSCRMTRPLAGGDCYRSVVRMAETGEQNMYAGDVYVLQGDQIVGMMGGMRFRRVPRTLMNHFFSPTARSAIRTEEVVVQPPSSRAIVPATLVSNDHVPPGAPVRAAAAMDVREGPGSRVVAETAECLEPETQQAEDGIVNDCLRIIARESGLEIKALQDDASFFELGIDSLMSLVLSDKFHSELQLEVKSSVFLECSNIAAFKEWLNQYH